MKQQIKYGFSSTILHADLKVDVDLANGRQMPATSSPELESIASATQSRAFNFAEIAEVYITQETQ